MPLSLQEPKSLKTPADIADLVEYPDFLAIVSSMARKAHLGYHATNDIVQETTLILLKKLELEGEFFGNAIAFAGRIARNKALEEMRYEMRTRALPDDPNGLPIAPNLPPSDDECSEEVMAYFCLDASERHAGFPKVYCVTQSQLAEYRGVSNATMTTRKKQAREKLDYFLHEIKRSALQWFYYNALHRSFFDLAFDLKLRLPGTDRCPIIKLSRPKILTGNRFLYLAKWSHEHYDPWFTIQATGELKPLFSLESELTWSIEWRPEEEYHRAESIFIDYGHPCFV